MFEGKFFLLSSKLLYKYLIKYWVMHILRHHKYIHIVGLNSDFKIGFRYCSVMGEIHHSQRLRSRSSWLTHTLLEFFYFDSNLIFSLHLIMYFFHIFILSFFFVLLSWDEYECGTISWILVDIQMLNPWHLMGFMDIFWATFDLNLLSRIPFESLMIIIFPFVFRFWFQGHIKGRYMQRFQRFWKLWIIL